MGTCFGALWCCSVAMLSNTGFGDTNYHHQLGQSQPHMGRFHFRESSSLSLSQFTFHVSHPISHLVGVCAAQLPTCPLPGIDCW